MLNIAYNYSTFRRNTVLGEHNFKHSPDVVVLPSSSDRIFNTESSLDLLHRFTNVRNTNHLRRQ